jgi:hypothetical protein
MNRNHELFAVATRAAFEPVLQGLSATRPRGISTLPLDWNPLSLRDFQFTEMRLVINGRRFYLGTDRTSRRQGSKPAVLKRVAA